MSHSVAPGIALEELRAELEGIDRTILLLLAERIHTARRAVELRRRHGAGATDLGQESRVLKRARGWAESLGVPPLLVDRLLRGLIEEGKRAPIGRPRSPVVTVFLASPGAPGAGLAARYAAVPAAHRSAPVEPLTAAAR